MNARPQARKLSRFEILAIAAVAIVVGREGASADTPAAGHGGTEPKMTDTARLEDALRRHAAALSVDIGDRTPFRPEKLARAADYIRGVSSKPGSLSRHRPTTTTGSASPT